MGVPPPAPRVAISGDLPFDFGATGEGTGAGTGAGTLASASSTAAAEVVVVGGFAGDGVAAAVKWISGNGSLSDDHGMVCEFVRV